MLIRRCLVVASWSLAAFLAACSTPATRTPQEAPLSPAASPAGPAAIRVAGEGTELHALQVDATIGEIHEAIVAAGGRRVTDPAAEAAGLEVVLLGDQAVDGLIRAVRPPNLAGLTWMGIPVRWHSASHSMGAALQSRSWPVITELGPRAVVEYRLLAEGEEQCRGELLVVPGEAVAIAAAGVSWPADVLDETPPDSHGATAMGWRSTESGHPVGLILLVPRFDSRGG